MFFYSDETDIERDFHYVRRARNVPQFSLFPKGMLGAVKKVLVIKRGASFSKV